MNTRKTLYNKPLTPPSALPTPLASSPAAFTLIELLVVVSIITLLVSVLVPALGRARSTAMQVTCQGQLHQWGLAFAMYAQENADYYPHADGLDRLGSQTPTTPAQAADQFGWVDMLPLTWQDRRWRDYPVWEKPGRGTIFQCPAARLGPDEWYGYRPQRDGFFSYAMNSCLELDENCWHHPEDTSWPMPSFLKTGFIRDPWRVYLLFDQLLDPARGYNGDHTNDSAGQHCASYPKAFSARHAHSGGTLGGSILFCDGHVQGQQSVWQPHWADDLEVPPRDDRNWYPYPAKQ